MDIINQFETSKQLETFMSKYSLWEHTELREELLNKKWQETLNFEGEDLSPLSPRELIQRTATFDDEVVSDQDQIQVEIANKWVNK